MPKSPLSQKRVLRSSIPLTTTVASTPNLRLKSAKRGRYRGRIDNRTKVDSVLAYMRQNYKWGIREFIEAFITADSAQAWAPTAEKRADILSSILSDHEERLAISTGSGNFNLNGITAAIRQELSAVPVDDNTKHLFGKFDQEFNIERVDYAATVHSLHSTAPILAELASVAYGCSEAESYRLRVKFRRV